ncbi:MAG: hypothetical protein WCP69_01165 [Bacteroidota bacterium]|jgi:hypothetical protein
MKRKVAFLTFVTIGLFTIAISCKDDNVHPDPLELTDGMSLTVSIKNSIYSPVLFDNYVEAIKRDSLNGSFLEGRRLVINAALNGNEKLQLVLTNWEANGGHADGIFPKGYIFGPTDTTKVSVILGDSTYTDKPFLMYKLSDDYIYQSDTSLVGSVFITYCNPLKKYINGIFTTTCVARPPNSDTLYIQGSFTNLKYYKKNTIY